MIAASYNDTDIVKILEISSFDGNASSYAVHPDGRVVIDHSVHRQQDVYNVLATLKNTPTSVMLKSPPCRRTSGRSSPAP